jgi:hypothetical protein
MMEKEITDYSRNSIRDFLIRSQAEAKGLVPAGKWKQEYDVRIR